MQQQLESFSYRIPIVMRPATQRPRPAPGRRAARRDRPHARGSGSSDAQSPQFCPTCETCRLFFAARQLLSGPRSGSAGPTPLPTVVARCSGPRQAESSADATRWANTQIWPSGSVAVNLLSPAGESSRSVDVCSRINRSCVKRLNVVHVDMDHRGRERIECSWTRKTPRLPARA